MRHFSFSCSARRAILALGCAASLAAAQPSASDSAADYSHAIALSVSGKNAVVQLRLPPAVYLNARSADLRDLRVFDAGGKALPFALMPPGARSQASRRELPVAVFPVTNAGSEASAVRNDVEIRTSADGAVTSITSRHGPGPKAGADGARLEALVFDMGKHEGAIDALVFTLPESMSNYHAQVELEASDDLRAWETLGNASLSWLANGERQTLTSNRMEFSPRRFRYARLTWREGTPIRFARIVAESSTLTDLPPAMDTVVLRPGAGKFPGDLVYNAAPAIPVRRMNLQFTQQNVVLPALLGNYVELPAVTGAAKGAATTRWDFRPRLQATFFQITQDGKLRKSGDVIVDEVHEASWVLRPQSATSDRPALKLAWMPATLVFMASGPGPYALRFGRADAAPAQRDIAQVAPGFSAAELQAVEQAVAGELKAGKAQPAAASDAEAAGSAARMRMLMLWGVLLLGVGVLGFMAWKLIVQMKNSGE